MGISKLKKSLLTIFPLLSYPSLIKDTLTILNSTQNPIWNKKHVFVGVENDEWNSSKLEISVWNYSSNADPKCLGKAEFTFNFLHYEIYYLL